MSYERFDPPLTAPSAVEPYKRIIAAMVPSMVGTGERFIIDYLHAKRASYLADEGETLWRPAYEIVVHVCEQYDLGRSGWEFRPAHAGACLLNLVEKGLVDWADYELMTDGGDLVVRCYSVAEKVEKVDLEDELGDFVSVWRDGESVPTTRVSTTYPRGATADLGRLSEAGTSLVWDGSDAPEWT